MNTKNRRYKLKMIKLQHQNNSVRQSNYNNRFSVVQKKRQYDALEDPHASYYFVNKSVRNHLKHIKNAAISQTTHSLEKQRLKKLFNQKIKFKPKDFFINKNGTYELQQLFINQTFRKGSIQSSNTTRLRQKRKINECAQRNDLKAVHSNQDLEAGEFPTLSQQLKQKKSIENQEQILQKGLYQRSNQKMYVQYKRRHSKPSKYQKINEKNHNKFINFIEEKKKLVMKLKQSLNPCQGQGKEQKK